MIKLVVGLGNPGPHYSLNRHNIGFMIIDALKEWHTLPPFKKYNQSLISEGMINNQRVMIMKPLTFMNLSGHAVGDLARFYKIQPQDILVIHDDIDLAYNDIRVKKAGGHGGHNGLKSIDAAIDKDYWRLRVGIGHPGHKDEVSTYVLDNFSKSEQDELVYKIRSIIDNLALLLQNQPEEFLRQLKNTAM